MRLVADFKGWKNDIDKFNREVEKMIRALRTDAKERSDKLNLKPGFNRVVWNMLYPGADDFDGMIVWSGGMAGPVAVPGTYKARLSKG